jgi:hypothetical protein
MLAETPTPGGRRGVLSAASGRGDVEQLGDLGDRLRAWVDVAHRGAWVAVAGLGHDQLQGDACLAKVGGGRVAELVQVPAWPTAAGAGGAVQQNAVAVVAEPGPGRCAGTGRWRQAGASGRVGGATGTAGRWCGCCHRAGAAAWAAGGRCRCPSRPTGSRRLWTGRERGAPPSRGPRRSARGSRRRGRRSHTASATASSRAGGGRGR